MTQGNYTNGGRPAIKSIDYAKLADIAQTSRISFETLCKRAEKGQPLNHMESEDPDWVGYYEASDILMTKYASLASSLTHCTKEIDYFGIGWKTKSKVKPKGKRGCGVLFYRADLVMVAKIKRGARLSTLAALRVFQAMQMGRI